MEDVTRQALDAIMRVAPVWATSLAGRTKVFTDDTMPTAYVTGGGGRFRIGIHPTLAASQVDMAFIIMHEIAHIFRRDLVSMEKNPQLAMKINIAADAIINDSLVKAGIRKPSIAGDMIFGQATYGFDCANKSINDLLNIPPKQQAEGKATAPSEMSEEGKNKEEQGEGEKSKPKEQAGGVGAEEEVCKEIGLGKDPFVHPDLKPMARSIAAYARRMFFEQGFKSKNFSTKNDWRRNRPAFSSRDDVRIPRQVWGAAGNERSGPLINLVLDVSGSMRQEWVATAALIADEIQAAGLDFDLWCTPVRRKAKRPKQYLKQLMTGGSQYNGLEDMSFPNMSHWYNGARDTELPKGVPSGATDSKDFDSGKGADELAALSLMETQDPVVWVYIGDYRSRMQKEMHGKANFLHIVLDKPGHSMDDTQACLDIMKKRGLPHWVYEIGAS